MGKRQRVVRQKPKGPVDPAMGHRFKQLRQAAGMTQAQVAAPEFSKGFISLIENGRTRMSLRAAEILAGKLGVPMAELLPDGSRSATIFPKGVDGQLKEAVGLMNHGIEFSLSARTALVSLFKDYTHAKTRVNKIQELIQAAPVPSNYPVSVKDWMSQYQTWLRALRSSALEKADHKEPGVLQSATTPKRKVGRPAYMGRIPTSAELGLRNESRTLNDQVFGRKSSEEIERRRSAEDVLADANKDRRREDW